MASHVTPWSCLALSPGSINSAPRTVCSKSFFRVGRTFWGSLFLKNSQIFLGNLSSFSRNSSNFLCNVASMDSGDNRFDQPTTNSEILVSPYIWPDKKRPHVCILGGGFGGLYTALRLESLSWPDDKKPQVVLVDQSDRFVFKPMLNELLSGEVDEWEIAPTFTELLKNTSVQFVKDKVKLLRPYDHLHHGQTNKVASNSA